MFEAFEQETQQAAEQQQAVSVPSTMQTAGAALPAAPPAVASEEVDAIVRDAACGVLGRSDLSADEPLLSAGLDSLGAVELRNSLEVSWP